VVRRVISAQIVHQDLLLVEAKRNEPMELVEEGREEENLGFNLSINWELCILKLCIENEI
jgi:hypothetical protein